MGKPKAKTRAIWEKRIARWQQCKMSAEEYAPLEGVRPSSLKWWRWRLGGEARRAAVPAKGRAMKGIRPANSVLRAVDAAALIGAGETTRIREES